MLLAIEGGAPASAQTVTNRESLTLRQTFTTLTAPVGGTVVGEALALATALEVATTPIGTSTGGFVFKLDPSTGLTARSATTFGPTFAERALTAGEGKVSFGVNFIGAGYDKLGDSSLDSLPTASIRSGSEAFSGHASLALTSKTLVMSGAMGVTDKFDIGVSVPLVSVKLDGITWLQDDVRKDANGDPIVQLLAKGGGVSSGLGDIAALAKYRLFRFGDDQPDPGGVSLLGVMRLPTGDRENLRGLGVTRTLAALVVSGGKGRFRPHANGGFEWWSEGVEVNTVDSAGRPLDSVTVRNQVQYAAGLEFEAAPKLTLIVDFLGRHIRGGGQVGSQTVTTTNPPATVEFPVPLHEGIRKLTLAPGLKLNLKGKLLLSLNALVALSDNGLHDRFVPVVGLDLNL